MIVNRKEPKKEFQHLFGQKVDIRVGSELYLNKTLYFAGTNYIGKEVITTKDDYGIIYVDDWNLVTIEKS